MTEPLSVRFDLAIPESRLFGEIRFVREVLDVVFYKGQPFYGRIAEPHFIAIRGERALIVRGNAKDFPANWEIPICKTR